MLKNTVGIYSIIILLFTIGTSYAQESITSSGGNSSGKGGTSSFTLGQVFYSSASGPSASHTQGVQQAFEISAISSIEESLGITLNALIYPNPASEFLVLKIEGEIPQNCQVSLYDNTGKVLRIIDISTAETTLRLRELLPSTYILKINQNLNSTTRKELKTFKIIKY